MTTRYGSPASCRPSASCTPRVSRLVYGHRSFGLLAQLDNRGAMSYPSHAVEPSAVSEGSAVSPEGAPQWTRRPSSAGSAPSSTLARCLDSRHCERGAHSQAGAGISAPSATRGSVRVTPKSRLTAQMGSTASTTPSVTTFLPRNGGGSQSERCCRLKSEPAVAPATPPRSVTRSRETRHRALRREGAGGPAPPSAGRSIAREARRPPPAAPVSPPGVVDFRRLSRMSGLLGCRHRSPNGVHGNRVRFMGKIGRMALFSFHRRQHDYEFGAARGAQGFQLNDIRFPESPSQARRSGSDQRLPLLLATCMLSIWKAACAAAPWIRVGLPV